MRATILPLSMREHNSDSLSGQPDQAASDTANGDSSRSGDSPGNHGKPPPGDSGPGPILEGRWWRRVLWLFVGMAVAMIVAAGVMMVRMLQDDRALRNVARATVVPAAVPGSGPVDVATAARPSMAGAVPLAGQRQAPAADSGTVALPAPAVIDSRGIAPAGPPHDNGASSPQPLPPAPTAAAAVGNEAPGANSRNTAASGEAGSNAAGPGNNDGKVRERVRTTAPAKAQARARTGAAARTADREETPRRGTVAQRAARRDETFRRCPPLGAKGAVTCRVHVCNGGAGKERACRPYLEHRP